MLKISDIPYDDKKAWGLIQNGLTCGVFQLETPLGQKWAKEIKPENITELSAVVALMRPAGLETGMIDKYSKVKHGLELMDSFGDDDVDRILAPTLSIMTYQEQLMAFGRDIAWKDLPHIDKLVATDRLRKGVSKKDSNLLQKLKDEFIEGCVRNGKSLELAEQLFDLIKSAGRYAFNDAHAKKYALWAYITAYMKAHNPYEFYTVYMTYSKAKQRPKEEVRKLVDEARIVGIKILPPSILRQNSAFKIVTDNGVRSIAFGLSHITHVSVKDVAAIQFNKPKTWQELFYSHFCSPKPISKKAVECLIEAGACDEFGLQRSLLISLFETLKELSPKETEYVGPKLLIMKDLNDFKTILLECAATVSVKKRRELIESQVNHGINFNCKDTFRWRAEKETYLIGLPLTCSAIDDTNSFFHNNCKDCAVTMDNNRNRKIEIACVIDEVIKLKTKKGQNPGQDMCQLIISDSSGSLRVAVFPSTYQELKDKIHAGLSYEMELNGTGSGWCINSLKEI